MQELGADAIVEPDTARDFLQVGGNFSEISAISLKMILVGRKGIHGVFDQLRRPPLGEHQRRLIQ